MQPQPQQMTDDELGDVMGELLEAASKDDIDSNRAPWGACVYRCGMTNCCKNRVTEKWCDKVKGTWTKHGTCP
jgi:hypothetical protein